MVLRLPGWGRWRARNRGFRRLIGGSRGATGGCPPSRRAGGDPRPADPVSQGSCSATPPQDLKPRYREIRQLPPLMCSVPSLGATSSKLFSEPTSRITERQELLITAEEREHPIRGDASKTFDLPAPPLLAGAPPWASRPSIPAYPLSGLPPSLTSRKGVYIDHAETGGSRITGAPGYGRGAHRSAGQTRLDSRG